MRKATIVIPTGVPLLSPPRGFCARGRNKDNPPASTLIGVAALFSEDASIEIEAVAAIP